MISGWWKEAASLGLQLNRSKSEVVCDNVKVCETMLCEAPGLCIVNCSITPLLGSPWVVLRALTTC